MEPIIYILIGFILLLLIIWRDEIRLLFKKADIKEVIEVLEAVNTLLVDLSVLLNTTPVKIEDITVVSMSIQSLIKELQDLLK